MKPQPRVLHPGAMLLSLAGLVGAAVLAALAADRPADPPDPQPAKIESVEQAVARLKELAPELGLAEAGKLDFARAKALFDRLEAIRPFVNKMDGQTRPHAIDGLARVSLLAGEAELAGDLLKLLLDDKDIKIDPSSREDRAAQCYLAAVLADNQDLSRAMLPRMNLAMAKQLGKNSDVIGRKLPAFKLDLVDGKTLRAGGEDHLIVLVAWAMLADDAHKKFLPAIRDLEHKYHSCPGFAMVGVNLNYAADRGRVGQCIREDLRFAHVFEGKGPEGATAKSLGMNELFGLLIIGPDNRVLYKGGVNDTPVVWAINYGLRQIEKKKAAARPAARLPASQPASTTPTSPVGAGPRPVSPTVSPAQQMLNLAETYRAGGLKQQADELLAKLIREHPDSPQAAKARELLKP